MKCQFCGQLIPDSAESNQSGVFSKVISRCTNSRCHSRIFVIGNRVNNPRREELGIGEIIDIKPMEIATEEKMNEKTMKYLVYFEVGIEKVLFEDEIRHYIWEIGDRVLLRQDVKSKSTASIPKRIGEIIEIKLDDPSRLIKYFIGEPDGSKTLISEVEIQRKLHQPIEEYYTGEIDPVNKFLLRLWSRQFHNLYTGNHIKCITNSRLSLMPHQVSVAYSLLQKGDARMILADEVGLGKTIEAGIFIKEMIARNLASRILIITPATILGQWEFEMHNKFNLKFTRLNSALMKQIEVNYHTGNLRNHATGEEFQLVTVSLQYARLSQCASVLTQLEWDIVIFDEAHHLRRYLSNQKSELYNTTLAYELAEQLADRTRSLLLLTATPIQLHAFDLYSLIALCNRFEFPTFESFEYARQQIPILNLVIRNLYNFTSINAFERKALVEQILSFDIPLTQEELDTKIRFQPNRYALIEQLEQKHFLSRYVVRNRRRIVFPNRKIRRIAQVVEVTLTPEESDVYRRIHLYLAQVYSQSFDSGATAVGFVMVVLQKLLTSSVPAITQSLRKRIKYLKENQDMLLKLGSENEFSREFTEDEATQDMGWGLDDFDLEDRAVVQKRKQTQNKSKKPMLNIQDHIKILEEFELLLQNLKQDSKADLLIKIIKEITEKNAHEKILIFTQFKQTLFYLARRIKSLGIQVAEFHGELNEQQKDRAVTGFRQEIPIMLSTEIGGEGRNFQFCHIIINYDLPWNPMRLEQRIGRLDRIGQTHDVLIYNFFIKDTVESSIILAIADRIHLFEESIGALEPILGDLEGKITDLVLRDNDEPLKFRLEEVIQKTNNQIESVEAKLEDLLLDKKSFQYDLISGDISREDQLTDIDLIIFMHAIQLHERPQNFEFKPITQLHQQGLWEIRFGKSLLHQLRIPQSDYIGVFDLDLARTQEEVDFFALGHPIVNILTQWFQRDEFGGEISAFKINAKIWLGLFEAPYLLRLPATERMDLQPVLDQTAGLYLFIFQIEFLGLISEYVLIPVLISDEGRLFPTLAQTFLRPHNFARICSIDQLPIPKTQLHRISPTITRDRLMELNDLAQQSTKEWIRTRMGELTDMNKQRYEQEQFRILKMAEFKQKYAEAQQSVMKEKLRAKKLKLPTERQLENLEKIPEEAKRKKRRAEFEEVMHEVKYYENEITRWQKIIEGLEFDTPEKLKRIKAHRTLKVNADLFALARIILE
jgi:superfamily II DNA or RNA helicase